MPLTDILKQSADRFRGKLALTMKMGYRTKRFTFREVYDLSRRTAAFLEEHGVKKGDKVLIYAPNSPYWVCVFWGALFRGAIVVPLAVQNTEEFVRKIGAQTKAKVLFTNRYSTFSPPEGIKHFVIDFLEEDTSEFEIEKEPQRYSSDDLALLMYTSGTTGDPKGVELTHQNLSFIIHTLNRHIALEQNEMVLSILPLSHIFEITVGFLLPFWKGGTIVYVHSSAAIGTLLREYHITKMVAVPEFLNLMMAKIETPRRFLFRILFSFSNALGIKPFQRLLFSPVLRKIGGRLDTIASGGASLDQELERKWDALGIHILQGYGLTETSGPVSANTYKEHQLGSVGKPLHGIHVRIEKDNEILVRGKSVFRGYFHDDIKTKEAFSENGYFKTGDLGELDSQGFLFIKGRKKYMIKGPGAQNVYPEDIEQVLNSIQGVKDSSVLGVEAPRGGVSIHAVLLLDQPLSSPEAIVKEANKKLASYQQITQWSIWPKDDFPRSATRKVKKEEVLEWLRLAKSALATNEVEGPKKTPLDELLSEITGVPAREISDSSNIVRDLSLDSLLRVELVARIEEKLGVEIDETAITQQTVVSELKELIRRAPAVKKPRFKTWPMSWWTKPIRAVSRFIVFNFMKIFVRLHVEGEENLKNSSLPAVFMTNHISPYDSVVLTMALPRHIRDRSSHAAAVDFLYEKFKWIAWFAEIVLNTFPISRREDGHIKLGLEYIGWMLTQGYSVTVFPEGRISESGKLQPLKHGAGLVAVEMGVPVVPVKIIGMNIIFPRKPWRGFIPRQASEVTVRFGKPLIFSHRESYKDATLKVEQAMMAL